MKHLSAAEFVDALDRRLPEERLSHLEACNACTGRLAVLRSGIADAIDVDVPDPSPLFWEQFRTRVGDAVRDTTPAAQPWWRHPAVAVLSSIVLVAGIGVGLRDARSHSADRPHAAAPVLSTTASPDAPAADDAAWDLLTDVASSVEEADPHATPVSVRPSSVDRAVGDLSAAERRELRRLLEDEMKRAGN